MSSAVQTMLDGRTAARPHGTSGYRSWCACCEPQESASPGKPQRRTPLRPQLAWRTRRDAALSQVAGDDHVL